jgi:hypothetical protein
MTRGRLFAVACVAAAVAVVGYIELVPSRSATEAPSSVRVLNIARIDIAQIDSLPEAPFVLFRDGSPGSSFGRLAVAALTMDQPTRSVTPLSCERVHYAAGMGICLVSDETRMPVRHEAFIFDRWFTRRPTIPLTGPPIRARVSPDGALAVTTVFETGHSYADAAFSTRTILIDTATSRRIADLEEFSIEKDGRPFKAVDFNFWGVTFAPDSDSFFATVKTAGQSYLIRGSIKARHASVLRSGVECPSLSPDGSLLVYKKPLVGEIGWRLHVLDLATQSERPLNQVTRSIDDQVDWFDAQQVIYHDSAETGTGVWVLPVDGVSPPRLLLPFAYSPAVQR